MAAPHALRSVPASADGGGQHAPKLLDLRKLDLNLAVVFLAIWRTASVSKAASELALSQAATSAALVRLREACGDPLFVRKRSGMEPTPRARDIAGTLETCLGELWHAFKGRAAFDAATVARKFSIGMSDDFELAYGPQLLRAVRQKNEGISLIFRQTNRHTVERMLESGEIELAVVSDTVRRAWIAQEQIGTSGYSCLFDAAASHIAMPVSLRDYLRMPHVLVSFSGHFGIVDKALKLKGMQRHVCAALTHFSAVPAFLRGMRAIATIPTHAAKALARAQPLTVSGVPVDLGEFPIRLLRRRADANDAGLSWLAEEIKSIVART